jgi:hypothetical protein
MNVFCQVDPDSVAVLLAYICRSVDLRRKIESALFEAISERLRNSNISFSTWLMFSAMSSAVDNNTFICVQIPGTPPFKCQHPTQQQLSADCNQVPHSSQL